MGLKKILFVPDCHHPYVDKRGWKLLLKVAEKLKPDYSVIMGDFMDCYAVSQHDKTHGRRADFEWELEETKAALHDLTDVCSNATRIFVAGNHEDRWPRFLAKHGQPDLKDTRIEKLLNLAYLGWKYVPYKDHTRIGKLYITHDTGRAGKNAIAQALDDYQSNVVIGHVHRMGVSYGGDVTGKTHVSASFGWLGSVSDIDYMHLAKARKEWQLGFGVGYLADSGVVHLSAIPMVDYQCVVEGELFK